jgi:hypothetical protein
MTRGETRTRLSTLIDVRGAWLERRGIPGRVIQKPVCCVAEEAGRIS